MPNCRKVLVKEGEDEYGDPLKNICGKCLPVKMWNAGLYLSSTAFLKESCVLVVVSYCWKKLKNRARRKHSPNCHFRKYLHCSSLDTSVLQRH